MLRVKIDAIFCVDFFMMVLFVGIILYFYVIGLFDRLI